MNYYDVSKRFLDTFRLSQNCPPSLYKHQGSYYEFDGTYYRNLSLNDFRRRLLDWVEATDFLNNTRPTSTIREVSTCIDSMVTLPDTAIPPFSFDNPFVRRNVITFSNGQIEIKPGKKPNRFILRGSDHDLFNVNFLDIPYNPEAEAPIFESFLEQMLPDPEVRSVIQEWFGLQLVPITTFQKFLILYGEGANGKSVLCTVLRSILGRGNYSSVGISAFHPNRSFGLQPTIGKLANIAEEIGHSDRACEGVLKQFVTGNEIAIDRKHQTAVNSSPTARLTFATNVKPTFRERSDGLWRRLILVPMEKQILDESKQNKAMVSEDYWKLKGELSGIVNWSLEGLRRLLARGSFDVPERLKKEVEEYKIECNPARQFLTEYTCYKQGSFTPSASLYDAYVRWCSEEGVEAQKKLNFAKEVGKAFPDASSDTQRVTIGRPVRGWKGVVLTSSLSSSDNVTV